MPYSSAVIPVMPNSEAVGLEADHITMVKFPGQEYINFRRVISSLLPMLNDCVEKVLSNWALYERTSSVPTIPQSLPYTLSLMLPYPRNERFVGRTQEMAHLEHILSQSQDAKRRTVAVLHGTGGMGKTQIALEFVYRNYKQYTAVLWINARSAEAATRDFVAIARRIYPEWNKPTKAQADSFPALQYMRRSSPLRLSSKPNSLSRTGFPKMTMADGS
jgi:hypothetical protein